MKEVLKTLILLRLSAFWFLLSPILNTENYAKTCDHGYIFSHYAPVFDEREIGIRLGSGGGHRVMIPPLP
jgi:hypothetical protein